MRFIKQHYPHVKWRRPKRNFFRAVIDSNGLPSRLNRWCCEELKESGGDGLIKVLGVRAAESVRRKKQWNPITQWRSGLGGFVVAPIVYWSTEEVWKFIKENDLPYCSLYDEGWKRLGCVGCPMAGKGRLAQFKRWPGFEKAWRHATRGYFNRRKGKLNRLGEPYYTSNALRAGMSFSIGGSLITQRQRTMKAKNASDCGMMLYETPLPLPPKRRPRPSHLRQAGRDCVCPRCRCCRAAEVF